MNCLHCQGKMRRDHAPLHIDRNGCHLTIDAVPAWVCNQCGEPFFEENEVRAVQNLIIAIEEKSRPLIAAA